MIDKKPAVGRWLFKDSVFHHEFGHNGGLITKISGKRIYITNMWGVDLQYSDEEYVMKYVAICDTKEELLDLIAHSKKCIAEHKELTNKQKAEFESFFTKESN